MSSNFSVSYNVSECYFASSARTNPQEFYGDQKTNIIEMALSPFDLNVLPCTEFTLEITRC